MPDDDMPALPTPWGEPLPLPQRREQVMSDLIVRANDSENYAHATGTCGDLAIYAYRAEQYGSGYRRLMLTRHSLGGDVEELFDATELTFPDDDPSDVALLVEAICADRLTVEEALARLADIHEAVRCEIQQYAA